MGLSLEQIRRNCNDARALMERAKREKFAVGAFNLDNQETLIAVCRAAKNTNSPVSLHGKICIFSLKLKVSSTGKMS